MYVVTSAMCCVTILVVVILFVIKPQVTIQDGMRGWTREDILIGSD